MKATKILAAAVAVLMLLTLTVCAAGPVYVIDLTNEANLANWGGTHSVDITYDAAEGCMLMSVTDSDPYSLYSIAEDDQFTGADYRFVKIAYKTAGVDEEFGQSQFFWKNEQYGGPVAETNFNWDREFEGEWGEQVLEILPTGGQDDAWDSKLQGFRVDCFQQGSYAATEQMWIKYIAFFATEEDANAYTFAPAAAEAEAPAAAEADVVIAPAPAAAQTADIFSAAIVVLAVSALAGATICTKKH